MEDRGNPILSKATSAEPWQPEQTSSPVSTRLERAESLLAPADPESIVMCLMPVLALVGASGLTQSDREEWLAAAVDALRNIPGDLLAGAVARAKMTCDHPSKVVPFIVKDVESAWAWRRRQLDEAAHAERQRTALPAPGKSYCTAEEAAEIIDRVFPQARQHSERPVHVDRGPPRTPTRNDYIALGVDPAYFDTKDAA